MPSESCLGPIFVQSYNHFYKNTLLQTQTLLIGLSTFMTPNKVFKTFNLIKIGILWVWKNLWGYGRKVHAKFWPWGTPWDPSYDHFYLLCQRTNS